jgi:methionine aminopeptidase
LPRLLHLCGTSQRVVSRSAKVCMVWDRLTPGSAFPTTLSVNNVVSHFSPLPSDPEVVLKEDDVVKVMLGIQLDGYAVTHAETIVLSSKVSGIAADAVKAAYDAAQAAMRAVKIGGKNWDVTEVVEKVAKSYGCSGVEGMLSCQHEKNVTDGKKRILLNPSPELKREHGTVEFAEGEVYGVDVLIVTGADGKVGGQVDQAKCRPNPTKAERPSTSVPTTPSTTSS